MKKIILATAIALSTTSAFAAGTAVIKVKGTLTNAACTAEWVTAVLSITALFVSVSYPKTHIINSVRNRYL